MVEVRLAGDATTATAEASFSSVIGWELPSAYRVAGYILGDATEAQDAVQEALERAWGGWPKLRNPESAKPWFWRILVNVCRTKLTTRGRVQVRDLNDGADLADSHDPFRASLLRDALGRAMAQLTPDQRIVVVLRYWGQLSMPEIGERLGIPEGTAKSRQHYALNILRRALQPDEEALR